MSSRKAQKSLLNHLVKRNFFGIPDKNVTGQKLVEFEKAKVEHAQKTAKMWKNLFLYTGIPIITLVGINTWRMESEHMEHLEHHPPKFKDLPHLHNRKKPFPWGDGYQSFFYNEKMQPRAEE